MKSQVIASSIIITLAIILSSNGFKAECTQTESMDLACKASDIALELAGDNELDPIESSGKKFKLTTRAFGGTGVLFAKVDISGYHASEFIDNNNFFFVSIIHPDDLELCRKNILEATTGKRHYEFESRIIHKNGQVEKEWNSKYKVTPFYENVIKEGKLL